MVIILISFLNPGAKERIIDQTIKQMTVEKNEDKIHIFTKATLNITLLRTKCFWIINFLRWC